MFIRKKPNKGGSIAVMLVAGERVPGKKHPVSRIIKHFGSAVEEAHIHALVQQAEAYKMSLKGLARNRALKVAADADVQSCYSYTVGFADVYEQWFTQVIGPLGLKPSVKQRLQELVVMRIAAPASKLKTARLGKAYGYEHQVDVLYKLMDQLTAPRISSLKQAIHHYSKKVLAEQKQTIDIVFYDLTTIYFETSSQDELRAFGFSKDGKHQHVQIMLAVMVTQEGLPIDYEEFPGNSYEVHTLIPVLTKIQARYQIGKVVLVADAALMNKINLHALTAQGIDYVIAARIKNTNAQIKEAIIDKEGYRTVTYPLSANDDSGEDEIRAKKIKLQTGDWLIVYHSTKRARKDQWDRQVALEKIKQYLASTGKNKLTARLKKTYVILKKDCSIEIHPEKLKREEQFDGFFGLQTNIQQANPSELLTAYRGLWQVEQTFRMAKSNLSIRPVFHYTPARMRAHFAICYIALALIRYVAFELKNSQIKISCEKLHELLDQMRIVKINDSHHHSFEFLQDPPLELFSIYQALGIPWRRKFKYTPSL